MSVPAESILLSSTVVPDGTVEAEVLPETAPEAVARERQALAQLLHDSLCQSLSGIGLVATLTERKARAHPELAQDVAALRKMICSACDEVHKLVQHLQAPPRGGSHTK